MYNSPSEVRYSSSVSPACSALGAGWQLIMGASATRRLLLLLLSESVSLSSGLKYRAITLKSL